MNPHLRRMLALTCVYLMLGVVFIMSSRFSSTNSIQIYETNGTENKGLESKMPKLTVSEHWNRKQLVVVEIDGVKHTVVADELKRAIDNAQNAHSW